jgi:hypothetical protein
MGSVESIEDCFVKEEFTLSVVTPAIITMEMLIDLFDSIDSDVSSTLSLKELIDRFEEMYPGQDVSD